jgi:excisionase family DNA binding protein
MSSENTTSENNLVKVPDAARVLNCTNQHIRNLIKRGEIEAYRPGYEYRIPKTSVHAFLERTAVRAKAA